MKMNAKMVKDNAGTMVAVGATVAALAAGSYYFFGPKGKQHRNKMKGWMLRMKAEVVENLEAAKEVTEPVYREIVDAVAKTHAEAGKISKAEVFALASDLKRQWRTISKLLPARGRTGGARRAAKPKTRTVKARKAGKK
jgi:hypothetical protein